MPYKPPVSDHSHPNKTTADSTPLHPETLAVRTAVERSQYGEHAEALYLTSSFLQPDAASAARRFAGEEPAYIYSRFTNPTVTSMEQRLAALEETEGCVATATGMSAILLIAMTFLQTGDHVVCSQSVFGSTVKLFAGILDRFGIETSFVPQSDVAAWKAACRPETQMLFAETPTNPLTEVCDIEALADVAHNCGALLAVDNCFATPALQKPTRFGADLIIHSGTKYLDGQGRVMAGAVCAREELTQQMVTTMRSTGMTPSPFNAWVILKGMETLHVRMRQQSSNALHIAQALEAHERVERVYYCGLPSHPQHELAMRQQNAMTDEHGNHVSMGGAVLSFQVKGNSPEELRKNAFAVIDGTELVSISTNLGDTRSIITHPASTSHGRLTEEQRLAAGITQGTIRLSVGLEHADDVLRDITRGL